MEKTYKSKLIQEISEEEIEKARQQVILFKTAIVNHDIGLLETLLHKQFRYFNDRTKEQTIIY